MSNRPTAKRRVRVVDTDHRTSKSTSFTLCVKDVETGVKSPYDLIRQYQVVIPRPRRRLVVSAAARTLRHPRPADRSIVGWPAVAALRVALVDAPLLSAVCDHGSTAWSRRRSERAPCAV